MKHKVIAVGVSLLVASSVLAQVKFSPDAEPDRIEYSDLAGKFGPVPTPKPGTKLGAIMKALSNEYWQLMKQGYEKAAPKYGVTVEVQAPNNEADQLGQLSIMNTMIGKNYDAFLVSPQSDANLVPGVAKAIAENKVVVNVADALVTEAPQFVGHNQMRQGVSVAEYLVKKFPRGGTVAIIEGQAGVYAASQRTQGFKEAIAKNTKFKLVASVPADWDRQKAFTVASDLLRKTPNLTAIYCNNDTMALGAVEAIKRAKRLGKTLVFGTDGINAAYESIKKGELTGTVDSFPMRTGEIGLEIALRVLGGQKLPRVIATPQALVLKENVEEIENQKK
jgi:ribose transport system substrate-binding protein